MKLETLKWGIIGCGDVTEVKSGPAFQKTENSALVAVMRRNAEKAEDYAKRHNVPKWYADAEKLINDPEINAIYVATPPGTHAEYAIKAMRAGKPVYVEKPMATSYAECLEMLKVSKESGMPINVAYYRRTLPAYLKVKELIENGTLGQILTVSITLHKAAEDPSTAKDNWRVDPKIAGGGLFYDLASHQLDYLDFLFGSVTEVNGIARNQAGYYTAEDTVSAIFTFENGVTGTGNWCFIVDQSAEQDKIEITGTKGKVSLPCFIHGDVELTTATGTEHFSFQNPENISHNLVKNLVKSLRGEELCVSTGESAARTNKILEEIVRNYYKKS
ncbi:Gfo/Idh/MocA family protein [Mangrovibacterium diazotrophicum]|uniref:Putative dehydrogenase n=1 Tax=Mangrovibacterium diazotrophicum TaxID=1261403 RepID=A0A419VZ64_9BACT|nr:Gfo/Idh/MocA family oxidoreductase [Mangrovibacterium diazotrophicum]RKD88511.1 putative dehydrogenase [Mangrovibacterium diazotrophicum]